MTLFCEFLSLEKGGTKAHEINKLNPQQVAKNNMLFAANIELLNISLL